LMPIFFEMETVLRLWLDVSDAQTVLFCRLILIYSLILSLNNPISIIVQATGRIRPYSVYVEIPTLFCFPATWALYALGYTAESAFYVMIVAIAVSHIIRLVCLKRLFFRFSYRRYVFGFLQPAILIMAFVSGAVYILHSMMASGILRLLIVIIVTIILVTLLCLFFGLSKFEKKTLFSMLKLNK